MLRALTCVLLNECADRAPNCVVEVARRLPVAMRGGLRAAEGFKASWLVLRPATCEELTAPNWATVSEPEGAGADGADPGCWK